MSSRRSGASGEPPVKHEGHGRLRGRLRGVRELTGPAAWTSVGRACETCPIRRRKGKDLRVKAIHCCSIVFGAWFVAACGGSDDGDGEVMPCEEVAGGGCVCGAEREPVLSECSEQSVEGAALCCDAGEFCQCTAFACGDDSELEYCSCGVRAVVLADGQTEVSSCTSGGGISCCLGAPFGPVGSLCSCSSLPCSDDETEVLSCDTNVVRDCGSTDEVAACL